MQRRRGVHTAAPQYLRRILAVADLLAMRTYDVLRARVCLATGSSCEHQCMQAACADASPAAAPANINGCKWHASKPRRRHLAMRTFNVLQAREAGTQCTRCPRAFDADQLAMCTFDVLHTKEAGT
jgi:hypothetical protein